MDRSVAILFAIGLQVAVLAGLLVNASIPLWFGNEIRLSTVPIDPRSLFRGNYARMNYDISNLPGDLLPNRGELRHGEVVFVKLNPNEDGIHEFESISLAKPGEGAFIRGRYQGHQRLNLDDSTQETLRIKYGIEAYFAPKEKALDLERRLRRSGAVARVMVSSSGKPALKSIE